MTIQYEHGPFLRFNLSMTHDGWNWTVRGPSRIAEIPDVLTFGFLSYESMLDDVLDGLAKRFPSLCFGGFVITKVEYP